MEALIQLLWAILPSLIVGIVLGVWNRKQNKKNKTEEENNKCALQKELLKIDLILASAQLSYAVAMAIKRGTPNGEMEKGIEQYEKAMETFEHFEREEFVRCQLNRKENAL